MGGKRVEDSVCKPATGELPESKASARGPQRNVKPSHFKLKIDTVHSKIWKPGLKSMSLPRISEFC